MSERKGGNKDDKEDKDKGEQQGEEKADKMAEPEKTGTVAKAANDRDQEDDDS